MAERVSFTTETDEETDDEFSLEGSLLKKKKKSPEKIGGLFAEKPEKAAEKTKAEERLRKLSDEALAATPLAEWRELRPDELSGGEVVVELHNETPEEEIPEPDEASEQPAAEATPDAEMSLDATPAEEDEPSARTADGNGRSGGGRSGNGTNTGSGTPPGNGPPPRTPGGSPSYSSPLPRRRAPTAGVTPLPRAAGLGVANSFNQLLTARQQADEAWAEGRGRGRREGLLAGLLVGGGVEHLRHKSREKKMEKKAKAEQSKQEKAEQAATARIGKLETQQDEFVRKATKERLDYEQKLNADAEAAVGAQTSEAAATARALAAEKARADAEKSKAELIERLNAQAAEQEKLEADALLKDPEHRIETSAWHAMEVDKSGHVVEDGSIEYGHEYYQERAHETGPKEHFDAKAGGAAVAAVMLSESGATRQQGASNPAPTAGSARPTFTQPSTLPPIIDEQSPDPGSIPARVSIVGIIPWLILLAILAVIIAVLQ